MATVPIEPQLTMSCEYGKPMNFIIDGEEYDLTDFIPKHPGGPDFLIWAAGRDVTIHVNTYHKDPINRVYPVLKKYKVSEKRDRKKVVKNKLGIPHFLLPPKFEAADDIPTYDFDPNNKKLLLNTARKKILDPKVQKEIKRLDNKFDNIAYCLMAVYACLLYTWLEGYIAWFIAVPAFTILRTGIAGAGHYFVHRPQPNFLSAVFDFNYVGMAFTAQDGHTLIHHMYTQSDADVKRGFFGGMMGVPRIFRMLVHTLHKLGHVTTGIMIRGYEVELEPDNNEHQGAQHHVRAIFPRRLPINWQFWLMHIWLRVELALALWSGVGGAWLMQFCTSLWMNTLMVVSSHDFVDVYEKDSKDWGRYQLLNSHDLSLTGNPWVDCFLSAGLSPHRAHHIFPYQRSGYANIFSNTYLAEAAKEHGLPWLKPKNYCTEIFPTIFKMYLWSPVCNPISRKPEHASFLEEHLDLECYKYIASYIIAGFYGIGSL